MRRRLFAPIAVAILVAAVPWGGGAEPERLPLINRPLCGTEAGAQAGDQDTIRVATFNVLHGLEETPAYPSHSTLDDRLELAAQEIAGEELDLIGMQEVSDTLEPIGHTPGNVTTRLAKRLVEITGDTWHWCWNLSNPHFPAEPDMAEGGGGPISDVIASMASDNYGSFKEGAAVLSRYPITIAESRRLPLRLPVEYVACPPPDVPNCNLTAMFDHRIALFARVATPGGDTDIFATHFVHGITAFSDYSAKVQFAALDLFAREQTLRHGSAARRFITCDCNLTDFNVVHSAVNLTKILGWTDSIVVFMPEVSDRRIATCAPGYSTLACTSDQDILSPVSTTTSRIDYVFGQDGTCDLSMIESRKFADQPSTTAEHQYLWPSDHHALWTDVAVDGCSA